MELALAACLKGREFYPDDVELLFQEGVVRREAGDRAGVRDCWLRALEPRRASTSPASTWACSATRPDICWRTWSSMPAT